MARTVSMRAVYFVNELLNTIEGSIKNIPYNTSTDDLRAIEQGKRMMASLQESMETGACERDLIGYVYEVRDHFHPLASGHFQDALTAAVLNVRYELGYIGDDKEDESRFDRDNTPVSRTLDALDNAEGFLNKLSTTDGHAPGRNMTTVEMRAIRGKLNALLDKLNQPEFEPTYKGEFKFEFEGKERD